jgi:hypothetical protein
MRLGDWQRTASEWESPPLASPLNCVYLAHRYSYSAPISFPWFDSEQSVGAETTQVQFHHEGLYGDRLICGYARTS